MDTTAVDDEFGEGGDEPFFTHIPSFFPLALRYRCQHDIVAQAIIRSGSDGVGRYEIGKMVGQNTRTKAGNRRVSNSITMVHKKYPKQIGSYQKMEGKYRMLKYFYKGDSAGPNAFAEYLEKLEALTGKKFPYGPEAVIKFPGKNLSTLRVTDITLRRFVFIFELLRDEDVIVTIWRIIKHIRQKDSALGYNFDVDKKSVLKCLYALERKQFLRIHTADVCETGFPPASTSSTESPPSLTTIQIITPYEIRSVDDPRVKTAVDRMVADFEANNRLFPTNQICYRADNKRKEAEKAAQKEAARKEKEEAKLAKQKVKEEAAVLKRSQRLAKKEVADSTEAHSEDDDEANTTEESGRHELSSLSALLPSEFELWRRKKSTVPVISERSLENISTRIRRHYNAQQTLTVHSTHRRNVKKLNRTSAASTESVTKTKGKKAAGKRKRRTSAQAADEDEAMEVDEEEAVVKEPVGKGRKRKYDEIDLQSQKKNLYLRSRFITREYDMLVMIRALSFFLNPVHRFWLNPTVMRDLMHEYNPESRCKTVNSLMAASAREMVRPGRIAQMQYVVKTLTTFSSMNEVRNKLVLNKFESEEEQNEFFKRTFRQAYQLIFNETRNVPLVSASDEEYREFARTKKFVSTEPNPMTFPRRCSEPQSLEDVAHCVAFNVVMGTMISEAFETGKSEEKTQEVVGAILNSLNPTTMTNSLMDCRSDGLITRIRPAGSVVCTRNRTIMSAYYRQYFHHQYRRDLIEIVKKMVGGYTDDFKKCTLEEHPLGLLVLATAMCSDADIRMDVSKLEQMLPREAKNDGTPKKSAKKSNVKQEQPEPEVLKPQRATKQLRHLENSPLNVEKITIDCPQFGPTATPITRAELESFLSPCFRAPTGDWEAAKKKFVAELEKRTTTGVSARDAEQLFDLLKTAEWAGVPLVELQKKFELTAAQTAELVHLLAESEVAFPCGVAKRRVVGAPFCDSWFVKLDGRMIAIRPWCFSNGEINWVGLRWMAEALLLTVCFKPGITLAQLSSLYAFVLQPVCLEELIVFLERIGCVVVDRKPLVTMKKFSPFSNVRVVDVQECALPAVDALARFAAFFMDTTIQWRTLKHTPPADPKK